MTRRDKAEGFSGWKRRFWRSAQILVGLLGVFTFVMLLVTPDVGIHAFWNVLIPVAPALLVVAPGVWRNVCPMASTALLARHMNRSRKRKLSARWNDRLALAGLALLLAVIPLRHVVMDNSAMATALAIALMAGVAALGGRFFEWKSFWCSGLCPVHHVERLYGSRAVFTADNAHCGSCERCVLLCPDSTPAMNPLTGARSRTRRVTGTVMVGGFAGYVWGWFQVPDYSGAAGWSHLGAAYGWPFAGLAVSLLLFLGIRILLPKSEGEWLTRLFAWAAVTCYYWYRLPALFGYGLFPGDGMLVDLTGVLPGTFPLISRIVTVALFAWLLLKEQTGAGRSWLYRPVTARSSA
jgi:hypothetical protein